MKKKKIITCVKKADDILKDVNLEWFNGKNAINISWNFGCIQGKMYENGLPHTRNNIIIISSEDINNFSENKLINTLIHEKTHIYQKIYPLDIKKYIEKHKFTKFKIRDKNDNIRANPDLDNWIYKDLSNNIYQASYNKNPSSIEDINYFPINNQLYEHPYEKMAIEIENYNL